ncbi:MAG: 1-acyl-sn-glycerol-3-phosphate acyltransferase, partial [Nannocystaceae bacterium]
MPNPRLLFRRRLALPQFRRPASKPGDPRIFGFNAERDLIISEVVGRVLGELGASSDSLMLTLNETAHHEIRRLETQRDEESAVHLPRWHRILRRVGAMDERKLKQTLREELDRMARDVAGNFDARVYDFALKLVRPTVVAAMNPRSMMSRERNRAALDLVLRCEGEVDVVQALAKKGTLVFVPTHSSNLDSLAVGEQLARRGLPPAVYGAGKNLFSNPIVSFFMHNLGAYRVDRRVKAGLYKSVLKAYACVLLERGYHMLFFPGGTRSRSGLVENRLKLGLAGTAAEAYARGIIRGRARRIFFVPITINYEIVLEAETLIEDFLKERGK